jgi:hypothetical protein
MLRCGVAHTGVSVYRRIGDVYIVKAIDPNAL